MSHGGSIGQARALFPQAPEPIVDLSTGINPHSYPLFDLPATVHRRLPEPSRLARLLEVAAGAYGAPSAATVLAAPGTQILLPLVAALVPPGRAVILGPTYAEHARSAAIAGHRVVEFADFEALGTADLAVVVNPNNPDGRLVDRGRLADLARRLSARGGILVVDEAFMDVGPSDGSLCGEAAGSGAIVLRSFGKFFGLAGVRLGFAVGPQRLLRRLDERLGPWAVSGAAIETGIVALGDRIWRDEMRGRLAAESGRLDAILAWSEIDVAGGTDLFRLVRLAAAQNLFRALGEAGIYVRRFDERPHELRLGLPADEAAWARLENALTAWRDEAASARRRSAR